MGKRVTECIGPRGPECPRSPGHRGTCIQLVSRSPKRWRPHRSDLPLPSMWQKPITTNVIYILWCPPLKEISRGAHSKWCTGPRIPSDGPVYDWQLFVSSPTDWAYSCFQQENCLHTICFLCLGLIQISLVSVCARSISFLFALWTLPILRICTALCLKKSQQS